MRLVIVGNAGAGKTTLARRLAREHDAAVLSLDAIAFVDGTPERRPLPESLTDLQAFMDAHPRWIVEGCYADLAAAALASADALRLLNPGVEACIAHCRARPFEPDKFATPAAQQAMLEPLIAWLREYPTRDDPCGLRAHRALVRGFAGDGREIASGDEL